MAAAKSKSTGAKSASKKKTTTARKPAKSTKAKSSSSTTAKKKTSTASKSSAKKTGIEVEIDQVRSVEENFVGKAVRQFVFVEVQAGGKEEQHVQEQLL